MTRVQMDLIDMRTRPDASTNGKTYRWILQLKDHFTKYCWGKALEHKEAREVYNSIREIFFLFGAPRILQSDNGREFVNQLINSLLSDFPGLTYLLSLYE
jgi:transposase InsO family protein